VDKPKPLSGGDRTALNKELGELRAMTNILAAQSAEMRARAETMDVLLEVSKAKLFGSAQ
jgi:hypothetical protein